jgi:hypothetical protein
VRRLAREPRPGNVHELVEDAWSTTAIEDAGDPQQRRPARAAGSALQPLKVPSSDPRSAS